MCAAGRVMPFTAVRKTEGGEPGPQLEKGASLGPIKFAMLTMESASGEAL